MLKDECIFLPLWEFQSSERSQIRISRMLFPKKEKEFFNSQQYLKNLETKKEYAVENPKRIKIKNDEEKYYVNSLITGFDGNKFRTKGLSIFRTQLPNFIEALENIRDGGYDEFINNFVHESYLPNPKKNISDNLESTSVPGKKLSAAGQKIVDEIGTGKTKNIEHVASKQKTDDDVFADWELSLSKEHQKEIKHLIKSGWTKEEAKIAFEAKYAVDNLR